ncbi:MAG TPA: hypothetical protein VJN18_34345 [Polyangiaceae bacterium]|nr:hypothetical protein [Polyangiaceae bacterium]
MGLVVSAGAFGCGDDEATGKGPEVSVAGAGGACAPRTCEELDVQCGETADGCGSTIECGEPCPEGQSGAAGAGPSDCADEVLDTPARNGRRASSSGFAAGDSSYLEIFDLACDDASTCVDDCVNRGGSDAMCDASECLPAVGAGNACVPAPIWGSLESIQVEDASVFNMAQIVLTTNPYRDVLLVDDFALDVPEGASILGITVEVRRAGDASVTDDSVRLLRGGQLVGVEHGKPDVWSDEPDWVTYGSSDDTWGEVWTPVDVSAEGFGVGLSAQYTEDAGNTRAYIDQVRVTVSYSTCE